MALSRLAVTHAGARGADQVGCSAASNEQLGGALEGWLRTGEASQPTGVGALLALRNTATLGCQEEGLFAEFTLGAGWAGKAVRHAG